MTGGIRVFMYVQHLLGIGHLKRAATLARAMTTEGLEVTLVSGGRPAPEIDVAGIDLRQLPPVRAADRTFQTLVDENDEAIDEAFRDSRRDTLLGLFREVDPRVLIIEQFPFGRRKLRFELLPLLEAASAQTPRPLILCSVRDILVTKKNPAREREMADTARRFFDRVVVHGDPEFVPFGATFPHAGEIADLITHTGYVIDPLPPVALAPALAPDQAPGEVVVSAGGGAVGRALLEAALAARPLSSLSGHVWRFRVGGASPEDELADLRRAAAEGVIVEPARGDFRSLLASAALSISQCGYNTAVEVLEAAIPAVMVPYAGGNETEQTARAGLLARAGRVEMVAESGLGGADGPRRLAAAIDVAVAGGPAPVPVVDLDGAATTARLVRRWAAGN